MYKATEKLLYEYSSIPLQVKEIDIKIKALGDNLGDLSNMSYEDKGSSGNSNNNSIVESRVVSKEKQEYRLNRKKEWLLLQKLKIDRSLTVLSDVEVNIITHRYFKRKTHVATSIAVGYSEGRCRKLTKDAVSKIMFMINLN